VDVLTIDSFAEKFATIDFVKIDTEGFELEVLDGMRTTLQTKQPQVIQLEFNVLHLWRGHTLLSLTKRLENYRFFRLLPNSMIEIDPTRFIDNVFIFSNIIAIRKDLQV
jgi:hypothetical protein